MIKAENLSYSFPHKELYNKISFTLEDDVHCAFIGTNGTGKSTLVNMILHPDKYLYDGKLIVDVPGRIGYVSQFYTIEREKEVTVFDYISEEFVRLQNKINQICEDMAATDHLEELMEEYPGRRVCPIDSMGASLGAGIPALKASSLVRQGMELDELVEKMTVYCQNYCQYFAVDDLKYLRKGGRISGASALVGSLLQIKPILRGNEEGKIVLFDKARGKLRAIERLVSIYKERAIDLDDLIGISHGDCPGEALRLETKLREAGHRGPILLVPHEPVTGAHVGPGMLSLYFHAVGK